MSVDVYLVNENGDQVYWSNITHNLAAMAESAGIYKHLWRPEEIGITKAGELIEPLREGLYRMVDNPSKFKIHDAPNGWGMYQHFVPWVAEYLEACVKTPDAKVEVSR